MIAIPVAIILCIVLFFSMSNSSKKEAVHSMCELAVDEAIADALNDNGLYSVMLNSHEDNLSFSSTRITGDSFQCKGTVHYNYMDIVDITADFICKGKIGSNSVNVSIDNIETKY